MPRCNVGVQQTVNLAFFDHASEVVGLDIKAAATPNVLVIIDDCVRTQHGSRDRQHVSATDFAFRSEEFLNSFHADSLVVDGANLVHVVFGSQPHLARHNAVRNHDISSFHAFETSDLSQHVDAADSMTEHTRKCFENTLGLCSESVIDVDQEMCSVLSKRVDRRHRSWKRVWKVM